ncbi:site-specific integrase [Streptomyces sp. TLI_171]|uniref:tyrosine-type recombinase/integrase n=1 Tax=Streptomyces sp. TLI_171 TaxID=1938859 RepID=UPI0015D53B08|nr:site-specific integrase [Streptomyces sp. TLI_171]
MKHGTWTYCVDLTPDEGRRRTRRRGGFATRAEATREMRAVLDGELRGVYENRRTTVASFLREWLVLQKVRLAPNTYAGYRACVERDLVPAFGHRRLLDLRPEHIDAWITAQLDAGRGAVTVYRAASTLRNALNAAVRSWRLRYNPADKEHYADQLTNLFEVMLGTGMRRGEALALHWDDVHVMDRKLFVRWTLAAIDNGKLTLGKPKTPASRAWISLSPRVVAALHRQAALQMSAHPEGRLEGLVFSTPGGAPLRPQWVLDQLRKRAAEISLPAIGLHDLRHTAASIMIAEGIPLAIVSKTLRHSTLATTINLYGHLFKDSADQAVHALSQALDRAQAGRTQTHFSRDDGGENPMPVAA